MDANHGSVSGTVDVRAVDYSNQEEGEQGVQLLKQSMVFKIDGSTVTPNRVQSLPGQKVYWLVEQADGVSITDAQLLAPRGTTGRSAAALTRAS